MLATSDNVITLLPDFLIGNCLIVSMLLYDLSRLRVKSTLSASRVPAGNLILSLLNEDSNSWIVKSLAANLIGSTQTLILSSLIPPTRILPTFLILENWSTRYLSA